MTQPAKVLLQTTITYASDDWHIGRFSILRNYLAGLKDSKGQPLFEVVARDRENDAWGNDRVLSNLADSDFDALWLIGADTGNGLSTEDAAGINAFRKRGGGVLGTRDHQDLGSCLCGLDEIGQAHYFHSTHPDPETVNCCVDDNISQSISWPNYHSGNNGDYHSIEVLEPVHPLLIKENGELIRYFPAHPHEGGIGAPPGSNARVIARAKSTITGRPFPLAVVFESHEGKGPAIAESSFHHFCDYNWDIDAGCPSFVEEKPGDGYKRHPEALDDTKAYVRNVALWLSDHRIEQKEISHEQNLFAPGSNP